MDFSSWAAPSRPTVHLVALDPSIIDTLATGELPEGEPIAPIRLSPGLVAPGPRRTWQYRSGQLATSPGDSAWITRALVDTGLGVTVGAAGFHGPPDANGMVEFGYQVDEERRRQGYARAALEAMLDAAAKDPAVHVIRATIAPDNVASRTLVLQYDFVEVGEQWDEEDGREIIFERPARA
jgi:ribosomal-protein-alanine N-acetyltransferase